ncbi:MAG: DUF3995 domain-containing protein [Solirubrobacterales bacterium]|nr:DUF3995 domain-containing protein [Solirubrobacterales bacterium]
MTRTSQMGRRGRGLAWAAFVIGVLSAAVSVYWGLGGTWLLDTVGGSLARLGRARNGVVIASVWGAAALKLIAAVLPLAAVRGHGGQAVWVLAWLASGILTLYGLVLSVVGWLVQAGVVHASANSDHLALAWHAYLWDPWFLVWGLLSAAALVRARDGR